MYLRILVGLYAGQILNFSAEAAQAMLADGRAIRVTDNCPDEPFCDPAPIPPAQPREAAAPASLPGKPAVADAPKAAKRK